MSVEVKFFRRPDQANDELPEWRTRLKMSLVISIRSAKRPFAQFRQVSRP
ncbi:hypothetical protein RRSWK_06446 [Rhodopirellula sp. SWK7]|nr:hypothetical protein RRSWK_06446 [Rhodopirellula sp. SWK7]